MVAFLGAAAIELAQAATQVHHEPRLGARVARRIDRLVVPLQHALCVGEGAVLLGRPGGRHEKYLCLHFSWVDAVHLPEVRRLHQERVAHDAPAELAHRGTLQPRAGAAGGEVFAHHEEALDLAVAHGEKQWIIGVVAIWWQLLQPLVAPLVLRGRFVAKPGLEQAHHVLRRIVPPAGGRRDHFEIAAERVFGFLRDIKITGEQVVQRRDVRRALDGGMAAQREDAAAGPPNVAQQRLENGSGADVLHADSVLGPAEGVAEGAGALAPAVGTECFGDLQENGLRGAADLLHHLRRVAREVLLEQLKDAARMLQRLVARRRSLRHTLIAPAIGLDCLCRMVDGGWGNLLALIAPAGGIVAFSNRVIAGEDAAEVFGVTEVFVDERRGVSIAHDVLFEVPLMVEHVLDESTEEGDVRAGANRRVDVRVGGRARVARIDVDHLRAALARLHDEAKADRMALRHVGAHDEDAVAIGDVPLRGGGAATSEACTQTGH